MGIDRNAADDAANRPPGSTQRAVAEMWSDVLQMTELPGADANFFELGGDSMAMVIVELRVQEAFGIDVPEGSLLSASTLGEFCAFIDTIR